LRGKAIVQMINAMQRNRVTNIEDVRVKGVSIQPASSMGSIESDKQKKYRLPAFSSQVELEQGPVETMANEQVTKYGIAKPPTDIADFIDT